MDFVTYSGKAPAPNHVRLMVSQVCLGVLMDAVVYIPEFSNIKKEAYAEFTRQYALLPTPLKVNPGFQLGHKILNMQSMAGTNNCQLNLELGKRCFMAANMEQAMHMLGEAERYLIPLSDGFRAIGWTLHGMAKLTHSSHEQLTKWLLKGCEENRVSLMIDDTNVMPKRRRG